MLKLKVIMTRSKVNSRSHYDITHLHPLIIVLTKYEHPVPIVSKIQIFLLLPDLPAPEQAVKVNSH